MNLEAFILGCGGMMPLPRRHLTSVLLRREGELFLFDCGEGTQVSLKRLNLKWKKISRIFISHMHADHITGLPGILMLSSQVDRDEPLYVYGPPKTKEYIEAHKNILEMYINYEIIVEEIFGKHTIFENDQYKIECFPLNHTKPCLGYSLTEKPRPGIFFPDKAKELNVPLGPLWADLQAGKEVSIENRIVKPEDVLGDERKGRKFTFVTDTAYFPEISDFVSNSDLLVCESMFSKDLIADAAGKKHLTSEQAGNIAEDAENVKQMGLIHYSPRYSDRDLKILEDEAKKVFKKSFLTRDRMVINIPFED